MTYHPDLLARPVPRYTSYPTAAEFTDHVGAEDQPRALGRVRGDEPLSLYLHVPFCEKICFYCGCNTGAANRSARLERYVAALHAEIELVAARLGGRGRVIRVAFGGGSPNALSPEQLEGLHSHILDALGGDHAAWSIEIDPRSLDEAFLDAVARIGFERASLGVQTFDPAIQEAIGRIQPLESIAAATQGLRKAGITSLNFDLMYGLPRQDAANFGATLDVAVDMRPDRLAVFGYAHVPQIIPRQRKIDDSALPGTEARFAMAQQAQRRLVDAGYATVGFDHFALPEDPLGRAAAAGRVRRNFQGYTDDPCNVSIGLGASAISRLPGLLVQNDKNGGRYGLKVGNGLFAAERGVLLTPLERIRGHAIEKLLCNGACDIRPLHDRQRIKAAVQPFVERGLASCKDGIIGIDPDKGWPYARAIAALFDPWRQDSKGRFSNAV
ncbi:oxygen-independent coproporphyrinogen III oxidase [Sphingomicrobium sediminis]|uniref:Coproporphyrinogen-III oxidase n=1 Tax=Sphingomicrobium sediminis TaxID=2950949 RepID=A0A9X2EMP4_9SPHN|nr:oxygen-independent coproporphyrinogen III oxidase [Sphingomicrobium sediminis]MCM8558214.1 oxygen-independent coproporphyrinogen III oxidase [Sphingomicrobium sediminis]